MGLREFFGMLPPRIALDATAAETEQVPVPDQVILILPGAGMEDIAVRNGDAVQTGQDLARPGAGPLVATATGRVTGVVCAAGPEGEPGVAVTIAVAGEETVSKDLAPIEDLAAATPEDLRLALLRAGLPATAALGRRVEIATLIVSAVPDAPGRVMDADLLASGEALAAALDVWQRASGARRVVLAIPAGARVPDGLPAAVTVARAPLAYPEGLPEMLAVRQGGWLFQQTPAGPFGDTIVVDLDVLLASLACLQEGRPYCERTLSCLTPGTRGPRNLTVRIGTPAVRVLEALGVTPEPGGKLLLGSPMRGVACPDPTHPVTPDTRQLVLQAPAEVHHFRTVTCTNCGACDRVCPVDLEVSALGRFAEYDRYDRCADLAVERCVDCGLCAYVCPAHRPVAQLMMHAKQTLWRSPERRVAPVDTAGCNACGPTCPALRLFDLDAEPQDSGKEKQA